jgi:hypothetical protein
MMSASALALGSSSGRLPHGIHHPKSGIYHLRYIPWYIQKRKMVYTMVYTIIYTMVYTMMIMLMPVIMIMIRVSRGLSDSDPLSLRLTGRLRLASSTCS